MPVVCQHKLVHGAEAVNDPDGRCNQEDDEKNASEGTDVPARRPSKPLQLGRRDKTEPETGGCHYNEVQHLGSVESHFVVGLVSCTSG